MSQTSYQDFVTDLAALTVEGVVRSFLWGETPPPGLNTADLPAMWVQEPSGDEAPITFVGGSGWPTLRATVIIAISAQGQDTIANGFVRSVEMMDNLAVALSGAKVAKSKCVWTISQDTVRVGRSWYPCVIAKVRTQG